MSETVQCVSIAPPPGSFIVVRRMVALVARTVGDNCGVALLSSGDMVRFWKMDWRYATREEKNIWIKETGTYSMVD